MPTHVVHKGILKEFDASTYLANVEIIGSVSLWLHDVPVSEALGVLEMVVGRSVAVLFINPNNPNDAVIIALWGAGETSKYWHHYPIPAGAFAPGLSGATWKNSDANTLGGWQLNAVGEQLFYHIHIDDDWDEATDMIFHVHFELNAAGSAGSDTVDLKAIFTYKGLGEAVLKTQTVEIATVVGAAAQYTLFEADFTINYDLASNVVQVEDIIAVTLNLETDTSEVDDIIVVHAELRYKTAKPNPVI